MKKTDVSSRLLRLLTGIVLTLAFHSISAQEVPDFLRPSYPGGDTAFCRHLMDNFRVPARMLTRAVTGTTRFRFVVSPEGHLSRIHIIPPVTRLLHSQNSSMSQEEFTATLVTVIVLFCASGTGIYGSLDAGMTGDSTILISKSILDLFTAAVFACNLGYVVSLVALPQLVIFLALFFGAKGILPMTTPDMIADFKACGGFLMVATGLRMTKIKSFPIADMIPAMVLAMPFSWLWSSCIVPLLG